MFHFSNLKNSNHAECLNYELIYVNKTMNHLDSRCYEFCMTLHFISKNNLKEMPILLKSIR